MVVDVDRRSLFRDGQRFDDSMTRFSLKYGYECLFKCSHAFTSPPTTTTQSNFFKPYVSKPSKFLERGIYLSISFKIYSPAKSN